MREERAFEGGHAQLEEWGKDRLTILCLPRASSTGYRLDVPPERRVDPWEWLAERGELGARVETMLVQAIRAEAAELGYNLLLEQAVDDTTGTRWLVCAAARVQGQSTMARPLAVGVLRDEALELALEIVKAHVELGQPWPTHVALARRQT